MGSAFITRRGGGTDVSGNFTSLLAPTSNYYQASLGTSTAYVNFATLTIDASLDSIIVLCQITETNAAVFITEPNVEVTCPGQVASGASNPNTTMTFKYERDGTSLKLYVKKDSTGNWKPSIYTRVVAK